MSLFRKSDYQKESKKNNVVSPRRGSHGGIATSKKVRYPTQHRTPNHKCAHCPRKDASKYSISAKEVRWLCPVCKIKSSRNKFTDDPNYFEERPNFLKASKMGVKR